MTTARSSGKAAQPAATNGAVYEVKALTLRGYLAQIEKLGALAEVKANVSADTLRMIENPPLPSAWISPTIFEEILGALESTRGLAAVRTVTKKGQEASTLPNARPIISGLLRLFGTSPATLLSRWPEFAKSMSRGIQFDWVLDAPNAGHLTITFPRKVPSLTFVSFESGCWLMLEMCGAKGAVAPAEIVEDGTKGVIRVSWVK